MKYRRFEAINSDVSLLGFGAMRLPTLINDPDSVDEAEAIRMIRYAIDHGVNYIDTAYVYHGKKSEIILGKALADGYREKVMIATKLPLWLCKTPEDVENIFNEQLEKLNVDYIDMYLIHNISGITLKKVGERKAWDFLVQKRNEGKICYIGFSFHGESPAEFKETIDTYPWDFCQLQINFIDKDIQAGIEGYEYAISKGVPIVIMEPLKGGRLTDAVHPTIKQHWDSLGTDRSPAEWALRWVANLPGILTILSGMSTMEQLEENVQVLSDADINSLSDSELELYDKIAEEYRRMTPYQCTGCKYCLPCSVGIDIPLVIEYRNSSVIYGKTEKEQINFNTWVGKKPSTCTICGMCEQKCQQHIEIMKAMKETAELYE